MGGVTTFVSFPASRVLPRPRRFRDNYRLMSTTKNEEDIDRTTTTRSSAAAAVVSLFWCGTAGLLKGPSTQIGLFYDLCVADRDITEDDAFVPRPGGRYKIGFDGCGNTHGTGGVLFACGLDEQRDKVIARVERCMEGGVRVILNCVGLSRGGCGVLKLLRALTSLRVDTHLLEVNALVFDPVPGNLVCSGVNNCFTVASKCTDVSSCAYVKRVLAVYPFEPLPDLAFHAPVLARYPKSCNVVEDVTLGCHQGALFDPFGRALDSALSYVRIRRFLVTCGTHLLSPTSGIYDASESELRAMERDVFRRANQWIESHAFGTIKGESVEISRRQCHSLHGCGRCLITRQMFNRLDAESAPSRVFLNQHHVELSRQYERRRHVDDRISYVLRVDRGHSFILPEPTCVGCGLLVFALIAVLVVMELFVGF